MSEPENPYRATGAALPELPERPGHLRAWIGVLLALLPFAFAQTVAPVLTNIYQNFDAELNMATQALVHWPALLALPAVGLALWRLLRPAGAAQSRALFWSGLAVGAALMVVALVLLYLPIFQLAATL